MNFTRTMPALGKLKLPADDYTWAPLAMRFTEGEAFRKLGGFPMRAASDDVSVRDVTAEMTSAAGGKLHGTLALTLHAGVAGRHTVTAAGHVTEVDLKVGNNAVELPCTYDKNGKHVTHFTVKAPGAARVCERDFPVRVDYQPIRLKFAKPGYRTDFFPGQDASKVAGTLTLTGAEVAEVTIEGTGFARQTATVRSGGAFAFDTKGFAVGGEATLAIRAGKDSKTVKIRNLKPRKGGMSWVENGVLVVNGRPVLRRNIYALHYMTGVWQDEIFAKDRASFRMTEDVIIPELSPTRLLPRGSNIEPRECVFDRSPSREVLDKVDEMIERNRESSVSGWFLVDEPECRNISPVWLRNMYEYITAKDPYRIVTTDSRGGKAYAECYDAIYTHPYLAPVNRPDGTRTYATPVSRIGSFPDAFGTVGRPDKVVGMVPGCFAYRWTSICNDYPTFDEYMASIWAGIVRGAVGQHVFAGHDMGDRPQLYHGTRYVFQSLEALEPLLLFGTRRTLAKENDFETCLWEKGADKLAVAVNFTEKPLVAKMPGLGGTWREFRATRTFAGAQLSSVELKPFETLILTTQDHDRGLETLADVVARVNRLEYERTHRDNQILERYDDIVLDSNTDGNFGGRLYKLIDGSRTMYARGQQRPSKDAHVTLDFRENLRPTVGRVRVYGHALDTMTAEVFANGAWTAPATKTGATEKYMREIVLDRPVVAEKLRLRFPDRARVEIYEIELPRRMERDKNEAE